MSNISALITADWHVRGRDRIYPRLPEAEGDTTVAARQFIDIARDLQPEWVLFLGDMADTTLQRAWGIAVLQQTLANLFDIGCKVGCVVGQHDRDEMVLLPSIDPRVQYLMQQQVQIGPWHCYGLDYRSPSNVQQALSEIPEGCDTLLTHQVWREFMGPHGFAQLDWLSPHIRRVVSGDFHVSAAKDFGNRTLFSPGSLAAQDVGEADMHNVLSLSTDGQVDWLPVQARRIYHITLTRCEQPREQIEQAVPEALKLQATGYPEIARNIVVVRYPGQWSQVPALLARDIGDEAHIYPYPESEDETAVSVSVVLPETASDTEVLSACLCRWLQGHPDLDRQIGDDALDLFQEPDASQAVERIAKRVQDAVV